MCRESNEFVWSSSRTYWQQVRSDRHNKSDQMPVLKYPVIRIHGKMEKLTSIACSAIQKYYQQRTYNHSNARHSVHFAVDYRSIWCTNLKVHVWISRGLGRFWVNKQYQKTQTDVLQLEQYHLKRQYWLKPKTISPFVGRHRGYVLCRYDVHRWSKNTSKLWRENNM